MYLAAANAHPFAEGFSGNAIQRCLWLLDKRRAAFRAVGGPTADIKVLELPIEEVLEELVSKCREASGLFHGKRNVCTGRGQAPSSLVPWALSINADLMNYLGINTGEKYVSVLCAQNAKSTNATLLQERK